MFESTLALLSDRAATTPVLLVLEDVHWADASTLDLLVYLAHHIEERRVVLLATYRPTMPRTAERMRRLADRVQRSGTALLLELGPLAGRRNSCPTRRPRGRPTHINDGDDPSRDPRATRSSPWSSPQRPQPANSRAGCAMC